MNNMLWNDLQAKIAWNSSRNSKTCMTSIWTLIDVNCLTKIFEKLRKTQSRSIILSLTIGLKSFIYLECYSCSPNTIHNLQTALKAITNNLIYLIPMSKSKHITYLDATHIVKQCITNIFQWLLMFFSESNDYYFI